MGFWVGLLVGLGLGMACLVGYRLRHRLRLQDLMGRVRVHSASPTMPYESQLASAIATQSEAIDQLTEQIDNFEQMLGRLPLGYLYVDDENRLLGGNLQAQTLLNVEQIVYTPPRLLLAVARSYELDELVEITRRRRQPCQREWVFYSISPDPANVSERPAYPLRGYGVPLSGGHVAVFLENRQEVVALTQQRDRWTSDVAHELKTPLTSIRLVAETLRSRVDDTLVGWLDRLLSEVMRLSQLVDDVLDLNRLDRVDSVTGEPESTELVRLLHQAWQNLMPLAALKHLQLDYQGPAQLEGVLHSELIYRLFINLFDNAIKYSPAGDPRRASGPIAVSVRLHTACLPALPEQPAVLIEVFDRGSGFLEKDLPFIFDRFYRSDLARSRPKSKAATTSTGLGLSIVRKIVDAHQGKIEAANHPETLGAWLKIWLPLQPMPFRIAPKSYDL